MDAPSFLKHFRTNISIKNCYRESISNVPSNNNIRQIHQSINQNGGESSQLLTGDRKSADRF